MGGGRDVSASPTRVSSSSDCVCVTVGSSDKLSTCPLTRGTMPGPGDTSSQPRVGGSSQNTGTQGPGCEQGVTQPGCPCTGSFSPFRSDLGTIWEETGLEGERWEEAYLSFKVVAKNINSSFSLLLSDYNLLHMKSSFRTFHVLRVNG